METDDTAELRRRHSELETLYDTVRDLSSTLSVQQVLDRLLKRTLHHLDAEIGSILLIDPDSSLRIVAAHGLPTTIADSATMPVGEGISGFVAERGRSLLISNVEVDPRFARSNHERYYTSSLISSPLIRMDSVLGVVNVNNKRSRTPFDGDDLRLLEAIAGAAAISLGNARQYEETLQQAQRDGLTGLANHGHLFTTLEQEIERAHRYDRRLAVAMIDIDHFKQFNDRFGHRAGDEALVCVANAILAVSRSHDIVARYGGEEFTVVLPETNSEGGVGFGERIRQAVENIHFGWAEEPELTVSVGIATLYASAGTATSLIEAADAQLYRAKSEGRNRVCSE